MAEENVKKVLLANKCDLDQSLQEVSNEEGKLLA